jgi:hypothetical protein
MGLDLGSPAGSSEELAHAGARGACQGCTNYNESNL